MEVWNPMLQLRAVKLPPPHQLLEPGLSFVTDEEAVNWPVHEVGRNADVFPPESGRLLAANTALTLTAASANTVAIFGR